MKDIYDVVVFGGGITGAGVFREAVKLGLNVLLLEKRDFAWGASSKSSKLVHGGLRYLKGGHLFLTRDSVKERERLINEIPGLVSRLEFMFPIFKNQSPGKLSMKTGLTLYDLLAGKRFHRYHSTNHVKEIFPYINSDKLTGGFTFADAQVDDTRLVQRLINEGKEAGGDALNYSYASKIIRNKDGFVESIIIKDSESQKEIGEIQTKAIINATGSWAEEIQSSPQKNLHLRPLRGSHLVFPQSRIPISQAIFFGHPKDNRPLFFAPWEGAVLFGTTDLDHHNSLEKEPNITAEEITYLFEALDLFFPDLKLSKKDCISSFAGIRPVLSNGKKDPSKESREHVVWKNKGLITVTGGKLTTFRLLAIDALKAALPSIGKPVSFNKNARIFDAMKTSVKKWNLPKDMGKRLTGRYGNRTPDLLKNSTEETLTVIPNTQTVWAEIPFVAKTETVRHLTDLLLRRVRIGLILPEGGAEHLDRIQELCSDGLEWDDSKWEQEKQAYVKNWNTYYSVENR